MYPIVNILCSDPTMNTCSKKWNIAIPNPMDHLDDGALDQQYFLPSTLDSDDTVQPDTISYDLANLEEEDFAEWRRMKKEELRVRQMQRIRERVSVHKKLKRELRQAHKLSQMESGFSGICWWHLKCWDGDMGLKTKKEEPSSPTLVNIKVESPPHTEPSIPL